MKLGNLFNMEEPEPKGSGSPYPEPEPDSSGVRLQLESPPERLPGSDFTGH